MSYRRGLVAGGHDPARSRRAALVMVYVADTTDLLCWTRLGGLDHRKVLRSMDMMSTKVFPHLRHLTPPALPESV